MSDNEDDLGEAAEQQPAKARVEDRLNEARGRFARAADAIVGHVRSVSGAARGRSASIGRRGRALGGRAIKAAAAVQERYGEQALPLREGYEQAREHAAGWADDLTDYVRQHPARAVAGAIAIGFFVGFLTRRRDDDG